MPNITVIYHFSFYLNNYLEINNEKKKIDEFLKER